MADTRNISAELFGDGGQIQPTKKPTKKQNLPPEDEDFIGEDRSVTNELFGDIQPAEPPPPPEPSLFDRGKNYLSSLVSEIPQPMEQRNYGKVGAPTREQAEPSGKLLEQFATTPLLPESIAKPAGQALLAPTVPGIALELAKQFSPTAENIQKGLQGSIAENLQGLSTPESLGISGALMTPAAPFVLAGLTPGAIKGTLEAGKQAYQDISQGAGAEQTTKDISNALVQTIMTVLGAKGLKEIPHALKGEAAPLPRQAEVVPELQPEIVNRLQEELYPKIIKGTPQEVENLNFSEEIARRLGGEPTLENVPPPKIIKGPQEVPPPIIQEPVINEAQPLPQQKVIKGLPEDRLELERQEQILNKLGVDPYAKPEQKVIKEKTVPESKEALQNQIQAVENGRSDAALITPGAEVPSVPKKLATVNTEVGIFAYDPAKITEGEILSKVANGSYGETLGYVEPKSPKTSQIVTAETPKGQEIKSAMVSPERVDEQIGFLKKQFPDSNIRVGGPEQAEKVIGERLKTAPLEYLKDLAAAGRGAEIADTFKKDLRRKFLLNEDKASAVATITDARAEAWAAQTGRPATEWYETRIKGIERRTDAGEPFAQGKIKGSVTFLDDGRAVINAFKKADVSTAVHELGHVFRRDLEGPLLRSAEEWAGVKNGAWKRSHEEKFARGFERYLRDGEAPTPKLAQVFEQFKNWLTQIYQKVTGSEINIKITPQIKEVFDRLLGAERESYANEVGQIKKGSGGEYSGVSRGQDLRTNEGQIRQRESGQASSGGGLLESARISEETPEVVRSRLRKELKVKPIGELLKDALPEELKTLFQGTSKALVEKNERQKIASQEILRRVNDYAREKGVSIQEALPRLNLTAEVYNKLREVAKREKVPLLEKERASSAIAETGLKTNKVVQGRESFRADKINAPEDIQRYLRATSEKAGEFKEQRLSKNDASVKKLAEDVGITVEDLLKAKPGSIANAETVFRSRQLIQEMAKDLRDSIKKTDISVATPEQIQALKEKHFRLMGVMKTVAGFRTEASNLFRQFNMKVDAGETALLKELMQKVKEAAIDDGTSLEAFSKKARELTEPTTQDKLWHVWYSSILSGPFTHIKNILGNATSLATEMTRVAVSSPKEVGASITGVFNGLLKGAKEAKRIFKEGDVSKFEERGQLPIKFKDKLSFLNALDYVGRTLSATDALFKGGFKGMEAGGLSRAQAVKEGFKGSELKARTKELFPEKYESPEVEAFGARGTYNQVPEGPIGVAADYIGKLTRKVPALKLVVPFTRVVANVLNNAIDYTPVGIIRGLKPDLLTKENAFKYESPRQRYQEIGRGALGTLALGYFSSLAAEGVLTGQGPSDFKKKQQLMATGWRPNSIRIGKKFYPYNSFGPLALGMALTGNYFDAMRYGKLDQEDLATRLGAAVMGSAKTILDMSFLQNLSDLLSSINNADREGGSYFKRFIAQQAGSLVPAAFKQIDRIFDPSIYDTETLREKIQSSLRITGGLKKKLNVWGEPLDTEATSNLIPSKITSDPMKRYLAENNLWVSVPSKNTEIFRPEENTTGIDENDRRPMTRDEYYDYIKISGEEIKERLTDELEEIKAFETHDEKQNYINEIVREIRQEVKESIEER